MLFAPADLAASVTTKSPCRETRAFAYHTAAESVRWEFVDAGLRIGLAGVKAGGGEVRLVVGIREVLRFQGKAAPLRIGLAALAPDDAVQKVTAIKLQTG